MEKVLEVKDVAKAYAPRGIKAVFNKSYRENNLIRAVDGVSFSINEGEIYGLLGPNGAGKSTIIKMITGLISKDAGKIFVAGYDVDKEMEKAKACIGAIIEAPTLFKNMSAVDNLRYFASLSGNVSESKIKSAIDTVGLTDRANDRVQTYSMGMKQRLGIAQAIMTSPKLLVLDEPTNGLDPEWIINTRELIKKLAREYNVSVLVCSHILSEMQELCDRVGIIYKGKLIVETSVDEIDKISADTKTIACYLTDNVALSYEIISSKYEKVIIKKGRVFVELYEKDIPLLTKELVLGGVNIFSVDVKKRSLEDLFKSIVMKHEEESREGENNADEML